MAEAADIKDGGILCFRPRNSMTGRILYYILHHRSFNEGNVFPSMHLSPMIAKNALCKTSDIMHIHREWEKALCYNGKDVLRHVSFIVRQNTEVANSIR